MSKTEQEILSIEGCISHVRSNFGTMYPQTKSRKHTLGNIPDGLHKQIISFSDKHHMTVAEAIASLWDFLTEYEGEYEVELKKHRDTPKKRRG